MRGTRSQTTFRLLRLSKGLNRSLARLAGADPDDLLDAGHEDLAVADLARARGLHDGLDRPLDQTVGEDNLDLGLGQKIDDVLGAAIKLGVAFLPAEALDLGYGQAGHADFGQRLTDFVELERLDDRFDLLHAALHGADGRAGLELHYTTRRHSSTRPTPK